MPPQPGYNISGQLEEPSGQHGTDADSLRFPHQVGMID